MLLPMLKHMLVQDPTLGLPAVSIVDHMYLGVRNGSGSSCNAQTFEYDPASMCWDETLGSALSIPELKKEIHTEIISLSLQLGLLRSQ